MKKQLLIACFLLVLGTGYAKEQVQETGLTIWTQAKLEEAAGGKDPIGGYNRVVFHINDACMKWLIRPLGTVWATIMPRPGMEIIRNACENLGYPRRVLSCLCTKEWTGAKDESIRFLINTTLGLGGMFDPAKYCFHYYDTQSDFCRALRVWGVDPGCTFMFPLTSVINVRDFGGTVLDYALDVRTYIPYAGWATLNQIILKENVYSKLMHNTVDPYHTYRLALLTDREIRDRMLVYHAANAAWKEAQEAEGKEFKEPEDVIPLTPPGVVNPIHIPYYESEGPLRDTIRSIYFRPKRDNHYWYIRLSLFNQDFEKKLETIPAGDGDNPYEFYYRQYVPEHAKKDDPAENLVLIIPGIGGLKESNGPLAMAELLYDNQYSVAVFDSAFSLPFLRSWSELTLPGYIPRDVDHTANMLESALKALKEQNRISDKTRISVVGWSYGGIQTLFLASRKPEEGSLLKPVRYLAINPPVDLAYALGQADTYTGISRKWTKEEAFENIVNAIALVMAKQEGQPRIFRGKPVNMHPHPYKVPLTDEQCQFLTALSFSMNIRDILLTMHLVRQFGNLKTGIEMADRMELLKEIDSVSFLKYVQHFLMQDPVLKDMQYEDLAKLCSLHAVENSLKTNPDIRVIHTADDILLRPEDRQWLSDTLGKRLIWFDYGGHLGNLYTEIVQNKIVELLKQ